MLELIDYYLILQIDPAAEVEVVRAAYRALAAKYHPDHEGGSAERMVDINRAWDVLGNPEKRATYDKSRVTLGPRLATTDTRSKAEPDHEGGLQPRPWSSRSGTVLDFGRYAGWSFPEIARQDPDFLEWLARMPIGRPYAAEIARTLAMYRPREQAPVAAAKPRGRFGR